MLEAYDTLLEMVVSADEAAMNGDIGYYRYECSCCGEEVYVAAVGSSAVVVHFRHRSGNNDTKCEKYLGGCGQRFYEKSTNGGNIEFYFDELQQTFQFGITFSDVGLQEHEKIKSRLYLSTVTETTYGMSRISLDPFFTTPISRSEFIPNTQKRLILTSFSKDYILWNDINKNKKPISFFRGKDQLTAFKILYNNDGYITAKLVKGESLYTDVRYLIISYRDNRRDIYEKFDLPKSIISEKEISFYTMGRNFFGRVITINDTNYETSIWCRNAGYDLAKSEEFGVLWPPMAVVDDVQITDAPTFFVFATFNLKPHGNTNLRAGDIISIDSYCYKLRIHSRLKIFNKNAEAVIEPRKDIIPLTSVGQADINADKVTAETDGRYFSFSCDGVAELKDGVGYLLFGDRHVRCYRSNYLVKQIFPRVEILEDMKEAINDAQKVYRATEQFTPSESFETGLSSLVENIIAESTKCGMINSAVKRLIQGGKI